MKDDKIIGKTFNLAITKLISSLGTNVGTIVSVLTLIGMGFIAGTNFNDYKKNIEILDIKKETFEEIKTLNVHINGLRDTIKVLGDRLSIEREINFNLKKNTDER